MKAQRRSRFIPTLAARWKIKYLVAPLVAAGLALLVRGCGFSDDFTCEHVKVAHAQCYLNGSGALAAGCAAERDYGVCLRSKYWGCYYDHECSGTDDTDTIVKLEACLAANKACE